MISNRLRDRIAALEQKQGQSDGALVVIVDWIKDGGESRGLADVGKERIEQRPGENYSSFMDRLNDAVSAEVSAGNYGCRIVIG